MLTRLFGIYIKDPDGKSHTSGRPNHGRQVQGDGLGEEVCRVHPEATRIETTINWNRGQNCVTGDTIWELCGIATWRTRALITHLRSLGVTGRTFRK